MTQFKNICSILMLLACFATSACASQSLDIKPVKIEVFSDTNVFAMDESGKYQIGQIGGKWSGVQDIQKLGLSLLDVTVATNDGMYLIGSEAHHDADKDIYYTGLIVLIDAGNKKVKEWRHETGFLKAAQYNDNITLTSFDGVYTLAASNDIKLVKDNDKRDALQPLYDNAGGVILCRPGSLAKIAALNGVAGCDKAGGWAFAGVWYPSNDDYTSEPVICGAWLIEPVQTKYKKPISEIIVRDLKSGDVVTKKKIADSHHVFCKNNSEILIDADMQSFTLPVMNPGDEYSCNNAEAIISLKKYNKESACLTSGGYLGVLKKKNSR